jgi:plastocyanin
MKKIIVIVVVLVLLIGGGVYIKSKNSSAPSATNANSMDMSDMATQNANANSSGDSTQPTATDKVVIQDFAFSPASITVKKGTTVTWTNQDSVAHTVTETDNQTGPKSGNLAKGQSYTFTFDTAGTFKYDCSIHPNMTGSVTVTE